MQHALTRWAGVGLGLTLLACGPDEPVVKSDDAALRRVPEPHEVDVRALDHEIRTVGVGPYALGAPLREVLSRLPYGPRIELVQIEGIADYSLVRAERDRIVIGVERPSGVTFVTVLDSNIARTEKDVGVGMATSAVAEKHGELYRSRGFASDPAILRAASMPGVQFVASRGSIDAVVVARPPPTSARKDSPCQPTVRPANLRAIVQAARLGADATISFGCFTGSSPEALVAKGNRIVVVSVGSSPKRLAQWSTPGLKYASAFEVDGDDRDEVIAVIEAKTPTSLTVTVDVLRVDGGRFASLARQPVYGLVDSTTSWIRARPSEVELLIEASARGGLVTVSGLYVHRRLFRAQEVFPLEAVPMVVRPQRRTPPNTAIDAGAPPLDSGTEETRKAPTGPGNKTRADDPGSP